MTSRARKRRSPRRTVFAVAEVAAVAQVTPLVRRVTLRGEELLGYRSEYLPGDAVKVLVPTPGERAAVLPTHDGSRVVFPPDAPAPTFRAYTIRDLRTSGEMDLDVVLHGEGPGARWARQVRPGSRVAMVGPKHEWWPDASARRLVLAGDETALPAIAAVTEALQEDVDVHAIVEVRDAAERQPLPTRARLTTTWLHRGPAPAHDSRLLHDAVRGATGTHPPTAGTRYWVAGETSVVKPIRAYLRKELSLGADVVDVYGYWRHGVTSTQVDVAVGQEHLRRTRAGTAPDDHHDLSELDLEVSPQTSSDVRDLLEDLAS